MAASYLVFDIETIIDPGLPLPVLKEGSSALPPSPYHSVVVIGVGWLTKKGVVQRLGIVGEGKSEPDILRDFVRFVEDRRPTMITWNGRGFDLPVIAARCLRFGIPFPYYYRQRDVRYRFSPEGHLDVMDYLADFGATRPMKLDIAAQLSGMPGKIGVDGKDVGPLVHQGRLAEVQAYCLSDVVQTTGVFLRAQLLRGELSRDEYLHAMNALLEACGDDERFEELLAKLNRPRLLLEELAHSAHSALGTAWLGVLKGAHRALTVFPAVARWVTPRASKGESPCAPPSWCEIGPWSCPTWRCPLGTAL